MWPVRSISVCVEARARRFWSLVGWMKLSAYKSVYHTPNPFHSFMQGFNAQCLKLLFEYIDYVSVLAIKSCRRREILYHTTAKIYPTLLQNAQFHSIEHRLYTYTVAFDDDRPCTTWHLVIPYILIWCSIYWVYTIKQTFCFEKHKVDLSDYVLYHA